MKSSRRNPININYNGFFYATMCHVCKQFDVRLKKCSGCKMIFYCGPEHQKQHWRHHRSLCKAIQDVLGTYSMEDRNETLEKWDTKKRNFMLLVALKLKRPLQLYERHMFEFPKECAICHEQNSQSLEDCRKCAGSFCKDHKDGMEHRDICAPLELCFRMDLTSVTEQNRPSRLDYLRKVSYTDKIQNITDFINTYADIRSRLKMYDILAAEHSQYLTRPLTVFHAMQLLDYVPERKDLIIHVIGSSYNEEATLVAWEVLLNLLEISSLVIIMIGPELECISNPLSVCMSRQKECWFKFHSGLYESYVHDSSFAKPDLIVGFNSGIHEQEFGSIEETWSPSIRLIAKQNCPVILTCYTREELKNGVERVNTILDKNIDYLYGRRNSFASLRPHRNLGPEKVFYENNYIIVYRSLCP